MFKVQSFMFCLLAYCLSDGAIAQVNEPEKLRTGNHDLRGEKAIFMVQSHQKKHDSLALFEMGNNQYMFDISSTRLKVSSDFAQKMDGEFVKNFIQLKYEMKSRPGELSCQSVFTLVLRGEKETICRGEQEKLGKVLALIDDMKKELNKK